MKVSSIIVNNFRLLKEFTIDLENNLSLVVGKNNCGKTSLLAVMNKFLNDKGSSSFLADDFNIEFRDAFQHLVENPASYTGEAMGINMKMFISYNETDDLAPISHLIMDLDPENTTLLLSFEYMIRADFFSAFVADFNAYKNESTVKINKNIQQQIKEGKLEKENEAEFRIQPMAKIFPNFFRKNHQNYFKLGRKSIYFDQKKEKENDRIFIDLMKENIKVDNVINFKVINAKREVSNKEADRALSTLSSDYYSIKENQSKESEPIKQFKDTLETTDDHLDAVYTGLFADVIDTVRQFGGTKAGESVIKVISTLQHRELLKGNTTVMYDHSKSHSLPESFNGLGYMNLIGMIFQIEVLLSDFRKEGKENELPTPINLLFIEEPEAHTHPQMQYIFIKNIKEILLKATKGSADKNSFALQTIITTHSSHIAAESDFPDLKYFARNTENSVTAKNLKDLEKQYTDDQDSYKFLKQYLTINRTELFFADKAILIEGDTERILLSTIMRKIDLEKEDRTLLPLLSQNISVVEVGAHAQIFEKLIEFLNIKTLIITDIDAYRLKPILGADGKPKLNKNGEERKVPSKCRVVEAEDYGNHAIRFFCGNPTFEALMKISHGQAICKKDGISWQISLDGSVYLAWQLEEKSYHARSYEDAFIALNQAFIEANLSKFRSLKNIDELSDLDPYDIAEHCVSKKTSFALDILYVTGEDYSLWEIPEYIEKGLLWLRK